MRADALPRGHGGHSKQLFQVLGDLGLGQGGHFADNGYGARMVAKSTPRATVWRGVSLVLSPIVTLVALATFA